MKETKYDPISLIFLILAVCVVLIVADQIVF